MSQKSIKGTPELAKTIKERRRELGLTIEEAASKAGVGTKTWCRYETGAPIRKDKVKGICKVLNWRVLLGETSDSSERISINMYKQHEAWSDYICGNYGEVAALSFAIGSDMLLDFVEEDLNSLSRLPKGSHIGQIDISMMKDLLPAQFLMRYDYDFLYFFKATIKQLRVDAVRCSKLVAHSVIQELALYFIAEESKYSFECMAQDMEMGDEEELDIRGDWVFDVLGDMDIVTFLMANEYLTSDNIYHFDHWTEIQFYEEEL